MPYYHGRDLAVIRANMANATIVLGSATPSLESFDNAHSGKYKNLRLPERIGGRPLATAELIDMREVFRRTGGNIFLGRSDWAITYFYLSHGISPFSLRCHPGLVPDRPRRITDLDLLPLFTSFCTWSAEWLLTRPGKKKKAAGVKFF
jgi:hypothetical protein